ncbi:MAG: hypothetical protein V2J89_03000, partial [Halieaceae bacterium]|nr:hypothetical protein [Halieaceae bacterium]
PDSSGTAGDEPLAWWINADHFDCALGERIVATLADASRGGFDSSTLSGDVGQVLTPAALVEYPQRVQRLLNAWQQQYPEAHRQLLQNTPPARVSGAIQP